MRPNFLVIVADDLGFTDTASFGGEIATPNLSRLASRGVRFTDFHTASACSPTRSMLFSGTDNHIAGLGQMAEFAQRIPSTFKGKPGYEGYLNFRVAALPELLADNGYHTFMSGKWHLGTTEDHWPDKRGFKDTFTLLPGAGNHYKYFPRDPDTGEYINFLPPLFAENGVRLDPETDIPQDYYSTTYFTDKFIEFLQKREEEMPFFGYLAYTAPHWPFQAPPEVVAKYVGRYDAGPMELRRERLARAVSLGIVPAGVDPHQVETQRDKPWSQLSPSEQATEARIMEVYAAMVEVMDTNIGRVLDELEKQNQLDNTFIVFMSDNGAEGMMMEAMATTAERFAHFISTYFNNTFDNIGRGDSFTYYSDEWAQAATAPYYMYKMWASEGGIRCPLIISYPQLDTPAGSIRTDFLTVMDILPTIIDLAGISHPAPHFRGRQVVHPRGVSLVPYLLGKADRIHSEETVTGWELFAQQAIRRGSYKALFIPPPLGSGKWQLFDLSQDVGETRNLADDMPELLNEMINHWSEYVAETGLVECTDVFYETLGGEYNKKIITE